MGNAGMLHANIVLLLSIMAITGFAKTQDTTCEDQVTSQMKFKLVKDCLSQVKTLFPKCSRDTGSGGPVDCSEILSLGHTKTGLYTIYPRSRVNGTKPVQVYCDMHTDGGGWTVIQRRDSFTTQTDFHRDWESYKIGFGSLEKDFWLGNDNIYTLTNQGVYSLRIDMRSKAGEYKYSMHDSFWIGNESTGYVLHVDDFKGNASNDLQTQDKMKFSTKDRQNDGHAENDACAVHFHGAWWYPPTGGCGLANLNGLYMPGVDNRNSNWWWNWTGYKGLHSSEMKIRHRSPEFK